MLDRFLNTLLRKTFSLPGPILTLFITVSKEKIYKKIILKMFILIPAEVYINLRLSDVTLTFVTSTRKPFSAPKIISSKL